jgi:membrane-bound inhibitor of C-type lysozyme
VDLRNQSDLNQLGKLVEKKDAKSLNRYSDNRVWYWSKGKLI